MKDLFDPYQTGSVQGVWKLGAFRGCGFQKASLDQLKSTPDESQNALGAITLIQHPSNGVG